MPPRFKVPAHSDPLKRWNFRKADWKRFCLLTGKSVERLPPPETPDIEREYQDFCESLLSAAQQCIPRCRRKNYVPCWDKECETLYRSFIRAPVGLLLIEPPRPSSLDYNRKSRSDGRKLLTPSTSRTLAARCGEQSTNLLAGLDASLACAPSRQIPSPRNSGRTGHTRLTAASPPGSSTNSCPTYGRFQRLTVTVSPNLSGRKNLLLPSDA